MWTKAQRTTSQAERRAPAQARPSCTLGALANIPNLLWVPAVVGTLILVIGALGWLFNQPWLFASLGPTAYLLAHTPSQPSARPYNLIVGHFLGVTMAFFALAVVGALEAPSLFVTHQLVGTRVLASGLALVATVACELLAGASHPPAAATVLLITLGGFPLSLQSIGAIVAGVLLMALMGEPLRRLRLPSAV